MSFSAVELIIKKREGGTLDSSEINWLVENFTSGVVVDEQMSAMAMAILLRGMNRTEIKDLTGAMIASGERLDFSKLGKATSDKHSTGGVGDKITLPLAPLVASYGVAVPQLSGRGLGHTGGTLDKLESIKNWNPNLTNAEMFDQLKTVGCVISAAGSGLAPADKRLYALRDVTGTVEAIPLIASSIMSKKIAEGTSSLVLDVKVGSGAFMKDISKARELAETLVSLGNDSGVRTSALLTDMSTPLGREIGNANEVRESMEVLAGGGPDDVIRLTIELATEMLRLSGIDADPQQNLTNGKAMDKWREMISAQGGDLDVALPTSKHSHDVVATESGYISKLDALSFGVASWRLGAGRARQTDAVVFGAGITLHKVLGDQVRAGEKLFTLHADDDKLFQAGLEMAQSGVEIGEKVVRADVILERILN